ncbi:MAG: multimodular transpeptidase-transglycosylase [Candidatus Magnetoglobus multicellularis str. Araruama]|uniref:peptidoglycan glycosyltransferase n=1 Tax=Candidatus Magnetoglobus multicellularis str. Araruama TaxID=890399 RepID=A0A1V1PHT8_9BACT|nr:MAG: multimodular transpeptidase-transglycosylase [Candidatus Magnetoglobus multicellularis str. Araruama]
MWGLIACIFIGLLLAGFVYIIKRNIPDFSSLKDYDPPVTTQVFDARKNVIAEFFYQRRFVKPLPLIPKRLIQAFISAEDARFYQHEGYDIKSIIRAFIKNMVAGRIVQGGSTITQQTARSFLTTRHKSYLRKLQEVILAYQLEQTFSKDHILFLYLNQIYLGYGAYGVEAASQNYFGKSINQMTLAECAALAGLPQAPARYAPDKNFSAFKARQKYVLKRMYNEGYITENDARQAFKQPLNIQPRKNHFTDNAPYFSEHVRIELENCLGAESLYNDGLRIYTTVDMQIQSTAQKALNNGLKAIEKRHNYPENTPRLQGALICMDLRNGHIKALVGGRDFSQSKFNRAVQAIRQPGSSFKPIIYSAALDAGFTAASIIIDAPIVMKDDEHDFVWKPDNYEKTFYGPTTLRRALALSRNLVTIKLLQKVGVEKVIDYARQLGITSPIQKDLSIALGSSGVSLIELIRAYAVFASGGF